MVLRLVGDHVNIQLVTKSDDDCFLESSGYGYVSVGMVGTIDVK